MNRAHAGDNTDSATRLITQHLHKTYWKYKRGLREDLRKQERIGILRKTDKRVVWKRQKGKNLPLYCPALLRTFEDTHLFTL